MSARSVECGRGPDTPHERLGRAADLIIERFAGDAPLMTEARKLLLSSGGSEAVARNSTSRERLLSALTAVVEPSEPPVVPIFGETDKC